jgi:hypothetical protein
MEDQGKGQWSPEPRGRGKEGALMTCASEEEEVFLDLSTTERRD